MKKKIFVISVNRSDYGIQKNLLQLLKKDKNIDLKLLISGSHLNPSLGKTKDEINLDKIKIFKEVKCNLKKYNSGEVLGYISSATKEFSKIYSKYKPDLIIILGDRYEMLAASIPSIILNIPIAHIHGGEITLGSFDNTIRNCITQISQLHFTCHDKYKNRVIRMGKNPNKVFNVGSLACENIKKVKLCSKKDIEKKFNINFSKKNALVTFHPITTENKLSKKYFSNLLKAIKHFKRINFIFTYPAPDPENLDIINILNKNIKKNKNFYIIKSFGQNFYFSVINNVDVVIGNSSSGIIEVPSFKKPTINIGTRQDGREQSKSIINTSYNIKDIKKSLDKALSKKFLNSLKKQNNIFYKKNTAKNIISVIKKYLNEQKFY